MDNNNNFEALIEAIECGDKIFVTFTASVDKVLI